MFERLMYGLPRVLLAALVIALVTSGCSRPAVKRAAESPSAESLDENMPALPERPAALETPKVVKGADLLTKADFMADPPIRAVTDLRWGEQLQPPGPKLCAVNEEGVWYTDAKGTVVSTLMFPSRCERPGILTVPSEDSCQFISRGSWGSDAALLTHDGEVVWTYGGDPGVDDMAAGDVDGDGTLEFAVGFNGDGGVHLLNSKGDKLWQEPDGNVWHVEIADLEGSGHPQIIHSCAAGQMVLRDSTGSVIRRCSVPTYFSQFTVCPWPDAAGQPRVICGGQDTVLVLDGQGEAVTELAAPDTGMLNTIAATPVKLVAGQPSYFAALLSYRHWDRSVLYVYDGQQSLVYEEILMGPAGAVLALPTGSGAEALIVGGTAHVWKYQAAGAGSGG